MIGALRHRGPDEFGAWRDENALLGHARLSIIDLATGQQPMSTPDGRYWITYMSSTGWACHSVQHVQQWRSYRSYGGACPARPTWWNTCSC